MTKRRELTDDELNDIWDLWRGSPVRGGADAIRFILSRVQLSAIAADRALQGEQDAPKNEVISAAIEWYETKFNKTQSEHRLAMSVLRFKSAVYRAAQGATE